MTVVNKLVNEQTNWWLLLEHFGRFYSMTISFLMFLYFIFAHDVALVSLADVNT